MGTGFHGGFGDTKGHQEQRKKIIQGLPKNPRSLLNKGWKDVTPSGMAENTTSRVYQDGDTGLKVRFDEGTPGADGFQGKDHYHVFNPDATSRRDMYLDGNGNPVARGSTKSHILPGEEP